MPAKLKSEDVYAMFEKEGYKVLSTYENVSVPIKYICPEGHHHQSYVKDFRRGIRCAKCRGLARPERKDIIKAYRREGYEVVSSIPDSPSSSTPLQVSCPKGHVYDTYYQLWKNGNRCPECRVYKGEAQAHNILTSMLNTKVKKQVPLYIKDRELKADFSFTYRGSTYFVEYDGEGHFKPVKFWGGQEGLNKQKERDKLKNNYLGNQLLRLNYKQTLDEMVDSLSSWFNLHGIPFTTGNLNVSTVPIDISRQIIEYYETHSLKDTENKFKVHNSEINRLYKRHYGMSKRDRKRGAHLDYDAICKHYLTHTMLETANEFNTSTSYVTDIFKKQYGKTKGEYLLSLE